jgi:outer membrane receptor protein involved in Fe transport
VKGAAATTLYGTEASAGVIQIFTKKGTQGAPAWSFSVEQGVTSLGHVGLKPGDDLLPTAEEAGSAELAQLAQDYAATGQFLNTCAVNPIGQRTLEEDADPLGCPASGTYLRNAHRQRYYLSVRGGSDETNYFLSGRWSSEDGVISPQGSDEWGLRGNFGFQPTANVTVQYNGSFSHRDITWIPDGDNAEGFLLNVFRRENGTTPQDNDILILDMKLNQFIDHFITGIQVSWVPTSRIRQRLNVGLDWYRSEYAEERPFGYYRVPVGDRENDTHQSRVLTLDYAGTWEVPFGSSLMSSFSWGGQVFELKIRRLNAFGEDFGLPGAKKDIDAAAVTRASENIVDLAAGGFFLQEMIGFKDQLFITAGVRWDGFSTFGDDFGLAAYPKVSAAYLISDNDFWPAWWDELKLRAAVGWSGRAPGTFDATRTWDAVSGDDAQLGVTPSNPGDPNLGPEKTREFELGAEGSLFGGRASFEYSYYNQTTFDALVGVQQVPSQGFVSQQLLNVGTIKNRGHEMGVNVVVIPSRNFDWEVGIRYANNKGVAEDLNGEILPIRGAAAVEIREGFAAPGLFGPKLKDPNAVGVGAIDRCTVPENRAEFDSDPDACGYVGPNMPVWNYGLSTRFTILRRLTIDALGEGQGGNFISMGTARQTVRRNVWPECVGVRDRVRAGDVANLTALQQGLCANAPAFIDWARSANMFRMRHITATYRLPGSWLPGVFKNMTVSASAKNLFLIAPDFRGLDPEAVEDPTTPENNSSDAGVGFRYSYYNMPIPRSFVFKLSADF